jgi:cytidylate kinase
MFRVLTISREFGSGGGQVARLAADRLGWKLLDRNLIDEIARAAHVDPELVRQFDERIDSWLHRISRRSLWHGALEGVAALDDTTCFDAETMTALAGSLIREAHQQGGCVVVGRGAQCILQKEEDVFHAYIYAPWREKVRRVRARVPSASDVAELIRSTDQRRAAFVRLNYGCEWANPHLYHMMICSSLGEERAAEAIVCAMGGVP